MSAPTLDGRMICVCNCTYQITGAGVLPTDPADRYYAGAGFTAPPKTFVGGASDIDACLVGTNPDGVVLAFRGTLPLGALSLESIPQNYQSLRDWMQNFNAVPVTPDWLAGTGAQVHSGFDAALEKLWRAAHEEMLAQVVQAGLGTPILLTGHSKGGAAAALAALRLWTAEQFYSQVVTFGAPRSGDRAFADLYNNSHILHTRYECTDDIVPHLPPSLGGFLDELQRFTQLIPWLPQTFAGMERHDYEPVGALKFIDWSGNVVPDSALLSSQRSLHLAARLLTFHFNEVGLDHHIECGRQYMATICPEGVC